MATVRPRVRAERSRLWPAPLVTAATGTAEICPAATSPAPPRRLGDRLLLLVRRVLADLGGLADEFFLYYEDVDLCRRAADRGWEVWHEPALTAIHHRPLQDRPVSPVLRLITRHALLTYALRHWPRWQARLLAGVVWLEAGLRRFALVARPPGGGGLVPRTGRTGPRPGTLPNRGGAAATATSRAHAEWREERPVVPHA